MKLSYFHQNIQHFLRSSRSSETVFNLLERLFTLFPRQLLDKTFFKIVGFVPCVFFPEIILGNLDPGKNTFKHKSFVVLVGELNNEFI